MSPKLLTVTLPDGLEVFCLSKIEGSDWPKIKQVEIEVHQMGDLIEDIQAVLKQRGFTEITVEQPPNLKEMPVYNLYALRSTS